MIRDHRIHVRAVELRAGELAQLVVFLLGARVHLRRQGNALVAGDGLEFFIGAAVVGHHPLAKLLDLIVRRFLLGKLAQLNLGDPSLGGLGHELAIACLEGATGLPFRSVRGGGGRAVGLRCVRLSGAGRISDRRDHATHGDQRRRDCRSRKI